MGKFSSFWNLLVQEEESLALFLVLLPVFQRDVGQASSCLCAFPYLRLAETPRLERAPGGRIRHHHLPKISGASWEPGIQLGNVLPGGSLGAAGRRWCFPIPAAWHIPRLFQDQETPNPSELIPTPDHFSREHPGSKSGARGSRCKPKMLQENQGHSPELFQKEWQLGKGMRWEQGAQAAPWAGARRVMAFTRWHPFPSATPGACGCSRQAGSHP